MYYKKYSSWNNWNPMKKSMKNLDEIEFRAQILMIENNA
jgi:hypothetical protein